MDIEKLVNALSEEDVKSSLIYFLRSYMTPAFGALPKNEVELIVLDVLDKVKAIENEPDLYELVSKLKVTRSKARGLIYDRELRRSSEDDLDEKVRTLLKKPLIQKKGSLYILEVENPLVSDHLRSKVKKLGFVSDGSFSPSIVKLSLDAVVALIESLLSDQQRDSVKGVLVKAGAPDTSFKGVINATLKKVASKVASDTGEALMENVTNFLSPIIDVGIDLLNVKANELFSETKDDSA